MVTNKPMFAPSSKKQEMFINSDSFMTIYGGAAGQENHIWG